MKYFIAYIYMIDKVNFLSNEILEVVEIETMGDIRKIEEKIAQELNNLIKESVIKCKDKEIDAVHIINFKKIKEYDGLRTDRVMNKSGRPSLAFRKRTTMSPEIFETEAQRSIQNVVERLIKNR